MADHGQALADLRGHREELVRRLEAAGCQIRGSSSTCPAPEHEDRNPSASIHQKDGAWRVRCHHCQRSWDAVDLDAMLRGVEPGEILRELREADRAPAAEQRQRRRQASGSPRVWPDLAALKASFAGAAFYEYRAPGDHRLDLLVIRIGEGSGKRFLQAHQSSQGIVLRGPRGLLPLYNRSRLQGAADVIVVEGEKDVHALHQVGHIATTSPGGAGKAALADWSPLAGQRRVFLWPDNDEVGERHMQDVAKILARLRPAPRVYRLAPANLPVEVPPKGDASDLIAAAEREFGPGLAEQTVVDALAEAKPLRASRALLDRINAAATAPPAPAWPWEAIERATGGLRLGTVTLLVGSPGASKSLAALQAAAMWRRDGHQVAVLELEEAQDFHLGRILAQADGNSALTDDRWLAKHQEQAQAAYLRHEGELEAMAAALWTPPDGQDLTPAWVLDWVRAQAEAGAEAIIVDPLTAVDAGDRPWDVHRRLVLELSRIASAQRVAIIAVHHPAKGEGRVKPSLDGLAGGAALSRFVQTVLWLEAIDESTAEVRTSGGRIHAEINRRIWMLKTRNGSGTGFAAGLWFDGQSLRMLERGLLVPQRKGQGS